MLHACHPHLVANYVNLGIWHDCTSYRASGGEVTGSNAYFEGILSVYEILFG